MKVGVIVGRFQVSKLTKGHDYFIDQVRGDFNNNVVMFIGETKNSERTAHDPLPFEARKRMIQEAYPLIKIFQIRDIGDYPKWVKSLDDKIEFLKELEEIPRDAEICICGSRDSVVDMYKENGGIHETKKYMDVKELSKTVSGTDLRDSIVRSFRPSWTEREREFLIWWYGRKERLS